MDSPKRKGRRRRRSGAVLAEMVLALPVLVILLLGIIEIGLYLFVQHHMYQVAREVARNMAVQEVTADEATETAKEYLEQWKLEYTVVATEVDPDVVVDISVDRDAAAFGDPLQIFPDGDCTVRVTMRLEN